MEQRIEREIVGYYRVSTQMQGIDGLGMDAQRNSIATYAKNNNCRILASYEEVETGRRSDLRNRPELRNALAHAKRANAVLVIARIDRLARNVLVTAQLLESGVEFIACDNPHANRLTIQIMAAMAEHESRLISERSKAAIAAAKARGTYKKSSLDHVSLEARRRGQALGVKAREEKLKAAYVDLVPLVLALRQSGLTYKAVANRLNELQQRTLMGRRWWSSTVCRLMHKSGVVIKVPRPKRPMPPGVQPIGVAASAAARIKQAREAYEPLMPLIRKLCELQFGPGRIARELDRLGHRSQAGGQMSCALVIGILRREKITYILHGNKIQSCHDSQPYGSKVAAELKKRRAEAYFEALKPIISDLHMSGKTLIEMSEALNSWGYRTTMGNTWNRGRLYRYLRSTDPNTRYRRR